mmetsp:Transcript_81003/g.249968  ORF Transcript_81003/g.249968 Transcript_81003/m.249968 type:complete len:375 (-) Transcript_81003:414-1538(-)
MPAPTGLRGMCKPMSPEEEQAWMEDIENEDDGEALEKLKTWLLPKTDGFFQAPSGHRLHVRATLPPMDPQAANVKAIVLYCHGMSGHVNGRPLAGGVFPRIAAKGFAVFGVDIAGHGYSEGVRNLVEDWNTVFTDWEEFVKALLGAAQPAPSRRDFCAGVSDQVLARLRRLPVFVVGVSMGGLVAMHVGLRMQQRKALCQRLQGVVLCCPALAVDLPPQPVQILLRNLVVPLCPMGIMPSCVSSSSKGKSSSLLDLTDPRQREIAEMDIRDCAGRFPGVGLGWGKGMRWATAGTFSEVYLGIEEDMRRVAYPLLVIHDPGDKICFFEGSQKLMELCASADKTLEAVDARGMHYLPMAMEDQFVSSITSWMLRRT